MKNKLKEYLLQEIPKLHHVSTEIRTIFLERLDENNTLAKGDGVPDHFCAFFLPVFKNKVFVGHHIKADDWIPPGGHIEKDELPIDTVHRESMEELQYDSRDNKITFFHLSVAPVSQHKRNCIVHYDLWYVIEMSSQPNFMYDKGEFYDARWMTIEEAVKKTKRQRIHTPLSHLQSILNAL